MSKDIIVIGHKNPDSDTICSAIAYANLKNMITDEHYVPMRAGELNPETIFVLDYFNVPTPNYTGDVRAQVKDAELNEGVVADKETSLRAAWNLLHNHKAPTLAVLDDEGKIEGIVSVGDIAKSFIINYDECVLTEVGTLCKNVVETVEGELLVGDADKRFTEGEVRVATVSTDMMCEIINKGDIVVMADKKEAQLCSIEQDAACIIVCLGVDVDQEVLEAAKEHNCAVIATKNDSFTTARLLNQSVPIKCLMLKDEILSFTEDDYIDDIKVQVAETRHREFPIVDAEGKYKGVLKRRNLLDVEKKRIVLVDHNEKAQAVKGATAAEIVELVDHHKIGHVQTMNPVFYRNQPVGSTATIVYGMYKSNGVEISREMAGLMLSAMLSDTLIFKSPTCTPIDVAAATELAKIAGVDPKEYGIEMLSAGSDFGDKTSEQIFNMDYKNFEAGGVTYGVGQVSSVNKAQLDDLKEQMLSYMDEVIKAGSVDMVYLMMTDILDEATDLLCAGPGALKTASAAFNVEEGDRSVYLKGAVSRKKQIIPFLSGALNK